MVMKKTSSKKLRIVVEQKFGPFVSLAEASAAKKRIKTKVQKGTFGATVKTQQGYVISHKITYLKNLDVPAAAVKQHLQSQLPSATVRVTKA